LEAAEVEARTRLLLPILEDTEKSRQSPSTPPARMNKQPNKSYTLASYGSTPLQGPPRRPFMSIDEHRIFVAHIQNFLGKGIPCLNGLTHDGCHANLPPRQCNRTHFTDEELKGLSVSPYIKMWLLPKGGFRLSPRILATGVTAAVETIREELQRST